MFCAYTWPRYQVSVYRTIGPLVLPPFLMSTFCYFLSIVSIVNSCKKQFKSYDKKKKKGQTNADSRGISN